MKIFTVHLSDASGTWSDPEFVPETFSFGAFFGLFFWTAYHRCWRASLVIILFEVILWGSQIYFPASLDFYLLIQFFLCLLIGLIGQDLRRSDLEANGLKIRAIVAGVSMEEALLRWRDKTLFDVAEEEHIKKY